LRRQFPIRANGIFSAGSPMRLLANCRKAASPRQLSWIHTRVSANVERASGMCAWCRQAQSIMMSA
jgi:hypothetical protein